MLVIFYIVEKRWGRENIMKSASLVLRMHCSPYTYMFYIYSVCDFRRSRQVDIMNQVSKLSGLCLLGVSVYVIFYRLGYCSDIAAVFVNRYIFIIKYQIHSQKKS